MAKISIIIPIYNVENYLKQCLDSVVNQTLKDIEIICIDDCSTDKSLKIAQEYARRDSRIILIKQTKNKGQGIARNLGLKIAKGKYIGFVDPDDYIENDMYEKMIKQALKVNADIVLCNVMRFDERSKHLYKVNYLKEVTNNNRTKDINIEGENIDKSVFLRSLLVSPSHCWNKIYKSTIIKENNIKFSPERCFEDVPFVTKAVLTSEKFSFINEPLYHYFQTSHSTTIKCKNRGDLLFKTIRNVREILDEYNYYKILEKNMNYFEFINCVFSWNVIPYQQKYEFIQLAKKELGNNIYNEFLQRIINVSVVIPVYNVEQYLRQCLDSVVNQTLKDIEIICINDGSTDNSLKILKEYSKKDSRITVINQKNQGVSVARNNGLNIAKGEFVAFIDSDDVLYQKEYLETLYIACKKHKADIAVAGIVTGKKHSKTRYLLEIDKEVITFDYYKKILLCGLPQHCFVWNKLYRRSALLESGIKFVSGVLYEDMIYTCQILYKMGKLVAVPKIKYFYRKRKNSIVTDKSSKAIQDYNMSKTFLHNFLRDKGINVEELEEHIKKYKFLGFTIFKTYTKERIRKNILFNCISWKERLWGNE